MNSGEQLGRIDGRLRLGFESFDPRQLLVYGLLNDVFLAPAEARCRELLRLEEVLCRGLLHRGAAGIAVYTLNNGLQFADELGWCGAQARSGSMREAFLRMTQRVPQGRRTVGDLFPGSGGKPEQGQTAAVPAATEPSAAAPTRGGLMPYAGSLQSLRAAFESLDRYLTVASESGQQAPRLAVLLPRAQTLFANRGSEQWHYLVSWFQKWSAPGFANASVLLFETDDLNLLPAELSRQGTPVSREARLQAVKSGLKLTRTGKSLPDELIGRLMSRIIVFGGLTEEMANQIVRPRLTEIAARLRDLHGLQLDFVSQLPEIVRQLLTNDAGLGARDLVGRLRSIEEEALVVQAGDRELKSVRLQVESGELRVVPARR
ncbi:MAG: hypothetical protein ACK6EB_45270 [Planctomyces sp.]